MFTFTQFGQPGKHKFLCARKQRLQYIHGGNGRIRQPFTRLAVNATFIRSTRFIQNRIETGIERIENVPNLLKRQARIMLPFFLTFFRLRIEIVKKASESLLLLFVQRIQAGIDAFEIVDINKYHLRVAIVFVHIREIPKQHITPENKFIQRLGGFFAQLLVTIVQGEQQTDAVRGIFARQPIEKIIDGNHLRGQHRLVGQLLEIMLQEKD